MKQQKLLITIISFIVVLQQSEACIPITIPTVPTVAPPTSAPTTLSPTTTTFESTTGSDSSNAATTTTAEVTTTTTTPPTTTTTTPPTTTTTTPPTTTTTVTTTTTTICPTTCGTWTSEGDKCFQLFTSALSWADSQTSCETNGGDLASIESQAEQDAVFALTAGGADTWIGANDILSNQEWLWSSNFATLDSYNNWWTNRPKDNENQDCVKMKTTGTWDNVICSKSLQYVCQRLPISSCAPTTATTTVTTSTTTTTVTTTIKTTTTLAPTCGQWEQEGSKCFQLCTRPTDWDLSQTVCESKGGNLAAPENQAEQDKVASLQNGEDTWIGGNDLALNQDWVWTSSAAFTYTNWFTNRPKDNVNQDCVKLRTDGTWDNVVCTKEFQFVCEKAC